MSRRSHLMQGAVAGLIGAAIMAAWFVAIDSASRQQPLFTFRFVSQAVFGDGGAVPLILYLALHFVLFAAVGALVNRTLHELSVTPTLPLGAAVGLLLFDVVFYAGVLIVGANIVREVGWPVVLSGNVVAGMAVTAYLRVVRRLPIVGIQEALQGHTIIREGLMTGILGAAAVALWFFLIDAAQGRPFFTPAALGSAFFSGVSDGAEVEISVAVVAGYTVLHLFAFALVGLVAARMTAEAERHPPVLLALVLLFVTLEVLSLGVLAAVAMWLFESVPWWTVIVANLIAAGVMGAYLWRRHPVLKENLLRGEVEEALYRA